MTNGSFSLGFSTNVLPHAIAVAQHPQRHHRREVERRDAGDDAERLAHRVHVDVGGGLLGESTLQQRGDAARELDVLDAARELAGRVGPHLAVLRREDGRDVGAVLVEEVTELEHDLGAARQRRPAPRGERLRRGRDRIVDFLDAREPDLGLLLTSRRVVHRTGASRRGRDPLPINPVFDVLHDDRLRLPALDHTMSVLTHSGPPVLRFRPGTRIHRGADSDRGPCCPCTRRPGR